MERFNKSRVILMPCRDYDEEEIYRQLQAGIRLLGGLEGLIERGRKSC